MCQSVTAPKKTKEWQGFGMVRTSGEVWLHAHQVWRTSDIGITSSKAVKGGGAHESRSVARPNAPHKCACGSMCHLFTSTAILELTQAPIEPIHDEDLYGSQGVLTSRG